MATVASVPTIEKRGRVPVRGAARGMRLAAMLVVVLGGSWIGFSRSVPAQPPAAPAGSDVFSDFLACEGMARPREELACFRAALKKYKIRFGLLRGTPDELVREDERRRMMTARPAGSSEGARPLPADDGMLHERADSPLEEKVRRHRLARATPDHVEATIVRARKDPLGYWIFTLDNGQVWKEASGSRLRDGRFEGRHATIKKGMFGSWHIKVEGIGTSGRVTRLR